jgi:hypothetical protein
MFENFSKINYYLNGQTLELTDIFKSIKIDTTNSTDVATTKNTNFERPDQLAQKIYGDSKLFWVNLALNEIKNPFRQWSQTDSSQLTQNSEDYDTKVFQFGNTSKYRPVNSDWFNSDELDSYAGVSLSDIQQDDIIVFETGSGSFELKTYGAGILDAVSSCGYPHFGQSDIPDNFLNRNNIVQISCGTNFTACLDDNGYIWAWGEDIGLESSGFILNGRLYNSPSGGYVHIDTTNNKIIATTGSGDFACFGSCADFTFTGQTNMKRSSWTSGPTLAGVGVKNDNTITLFGPIVSTNSTLQYFSDVSCADEYCLGAVTGGASNGVVVGFGPTGYFSQIGQNTFYSQQLTDLGIVTPSNPIYPFTDNNFNIIKKYAKDSVLEISLKDILPFNGTTPYRSDYNFVFSSKNSPYNAIIGFTDKNKNSKDGFILNNSKLFYESHPYFENVGGPGDTFYQTEGGLTSTFNYNNNFYNLKPIINDGVYWNEFAITDNFENRYFGLTFIDDVEFSNILGYFPRKNAFGYDFISLPSFLPKFRKNNFPIQNIFNNPKMYFTDTLENGKGITFINRYWNTSLSVPSYSDLYEEPYNEPPISVSYIEEGTYSVSLYDNGKVIIKNPNTPIPRFLWQRFNETNPFYDPNAYSFTTIINLYVAINGITTPVSGWDDTKYISSLSNIVSLSKNSEKVVYALDINGNPYTIIRSFWNEINDNLLDDLAETDPVWLEYKAYPKALTPPSGITWTYVEHAPNYGSWAAGLAADKSIHIWGITAELNYRFNQSTSHYNTGITADYITVNTDNISYIKNQKIGVITNFDYNFQTLHGTTVTNAIKIIGPREINESIPDGRNVLVALKSDNSLSFHGTFSPTLDFLGFTFGVVDLNEIRDTSVPLVQHMAKYLASPRGLKTGLKTLNDMQGNIENISGTNHLLLIEGPNGKKILGTLCYADFFTVTAITTLLQKLIPQFYGLTGNIEFEQYSDTYAYLFKDSDKNKYFSVVGGYYAPILPDSIDDVSYINQFRDYDYNRIPYFVRMVTQHSDLYTFNKITIDSGTDVDNDVYGGWVDALQNDIWYGSGGGADLTSKDMSSVNSGCAFVFHKRVLSAIFRSPYYFGCTSIREFANEIEKVVCGENYIILLHSNKKITVVYGTGVPHNNSIDFTNFNTLLFNDPGSDENLNDLSDNIGHAGGSWYALPVDSTKPVRYWGSLTIPEEMPSGVSYIHGSMDCNANHCCALTSTGDPDNDAYGYGIVDCWGSYTPSSNFTNNNTEIPISPPSSLGICYAVRSGLNHSCAIDSFENVHCWGDNTYNQCNVPPSVNDGTGNRDLICGNSWSMVWKSDGRLIAWGQGISYDNIPLYSTTPKEMDGPWST